MNKKAQAIAWLKEEIRSLELAPELNGRPMTPEWAEQLEIMRTCLEAVQDHFPDSTKMIDHFPDTTKMVPLTLEQLREMGGKPVWVERNEAPYDGKWFIVDHADVENPDRTLYTKEGVTYSDYGVYFTAYACHPAHIDWESWTAEWEEDGECDHKPYRIRSAEKWKKYKCSKCGYKAGRRTSQKYCPSCGKAMTPEAWDELEKRLRGTNP